jgi:hypothetical protein
MRINNSNFHLKKKFFFSLGWHVTFPFLESLGLILRNFATIFIFILRNTKQIFCAKFREISYCEISIHPSQNAILNETVASRPIPMQNNLVLLRSAWVYRKSEMLSSQMATLDDNKKHKSRLMIRTRRIT